MRPYDKPVAIKLKWVRYKRGFQEPSSIEFGIFMDKLAMDASEVTTMVQPKGEESRGKRVIYISIATHLPRKK